MKTFTFKRNYPAKIKLPDWLKIRILESQLNGTKIYFIALLLLIFFISFLPKKIKADIVGVLNGNPAIIETYDEVTWAVLNSDTLKMTGWVILGAQCVTLNRENNTYYVILLIHTGPRLATVDPSTGICDDIGPLGGYISSLTFSSAGTLYGMGWSNVYAKKLYRIDTATAIPTFVAGPFDLGEYYHIIAYNPEDNNIYHWAGGAPNANMGRIDLSTLIETPIVQSGTAHSEIFGAAYIGAGIFILTDIEFRALYITNSGYVSVQHTGFPTQIWGLGFNGTLLPVELSSFTSTTIRRDVELRWTTTSELNNSQFDIERGVTEDQWIKAGSVAGNGTITSPMEYSFIDRNLNTGTYNYRLKQIDFNGNFEYFYLGNEVNVGTPEKFELSQNYPNPFNPSTQINYDLPYDALINISLFDISGKEIATLVNEIKTAGYYTLNYNSSGDLSSGAYFYRMRAETNRQSFFSMKKMILVK